MEQQDIPLPLKERALLDSASRLKVMTVKSRSIIYTERMAIWVIRQEKLSLLVSLTHHPEFNEAVNNSNFQQWVLVGTNRLGKFGSESGIIIKRSGYAESW